MKLNLHTITPNRRNGKSIFGMLHSALYLAINHHGRVLYGCEDKDRASQRLWTEYPHLIQQRVEHGIILTYLRCEL